MRWRAHHDVLKSNGKKAAEIVLEGTILDMLTRKPVRPSEELIGIFGLLPRTRDFEVLPDGRWAA